MRALIFAAGLGTRLKPLTDTMPKALVPVGGLPLLDHVLRKLRAAGIGEAVVNVHHFADRIIEWIDAHPVEGLRVSVSDERDFLRETGGGIRYAERLLRPSVPSSFALPASSPSASPAPSSFALPASSSSASPASSSSAGLPADPSPSSVAAIAAERTDGCFLVHNVDILSNLDLARFASQAPADALATLAVSDRKTQRYFLFKEEDSVSESAAAVPCHAPSASVARADGPTPLLPVSPSPRLRLVGWTNVATGEVRTPFPDLDVTACRKLAFSGIHLISNRIFEVFRSVDAACDQSACDQSASVRLQGSSVRSDRDLSTGDGPAPLGERFSITDFYLRVCAEYPIYGIVPPDFRMIDVGKLDTLAAAEDFLRCERREG